MDRERLAAQLKKSDLEDLIQDSTWIRSYEISADTVLRVLEPIENPEGGVARVFRVDTPMGQKALRIDFAHAVGNRSIGFILHIFLSRAGITPKMHGYLDGESLTLLMRSHSSLATIRTPWPEYPNAAPISAQILDIVPDGWNVLRTQKPSRTPAAIHRWDFDKILWEVRFIQDTLRRLDIQLLDPQFLICSEGSVQLIDLEHCLFIDSQENYWAYAGLETARYKEWVSHRREIRNDYTQAVLSELVMRRDT